MKHTTIIAGELQIDHERGVVYFHANVEAMKAGYTNTPLRICGLGKIEAPLGDRQIDLTIAQKLFNRDTHKYDRNEVKVSK